MRHLTRGEILWPLCLALRRSCSGGVRCFFTSSFDYFQALLGCRRSDRRTRNDVTLCDAADVRPVPPAQTLRSGLHWFYPRVPLLWMTRVHHCGHSLCQQPQLSLSLTWCPQVTAASATGDTRDRAFGQWCSGLAPSIELLFLFGGHCTRKTGSFVFVPLMFLGSWRAILGDTGAYSADVSFM